ncbi:MAG: hypothetical protein JJV93_00980 [Alphaproteobacteria bacterium]|nr:hypothetical protein [Alphaproteobacteria bacterium]
MRETILQRTLFLLTAVFLSSCSVSHNSSLESYAVKGLYKNAEYPDISVKRDSKFEGITVDLYLPKRDTKYKDYRDIISLYSLYNPSKMRVNFYNIEELEDKIEGILSLEVLPNENVLPNEAVLSNENVIMVGGDIISTKKAKRLQELGYILVHLDGWETPSEYSYSSQVSEVSRVFSLMSSIKDADKLIVIGPKKEISREISTIVDETDKQLVSYFSYESGDSESIKEVVKQSTYYEDRVENKNKLLIALNMIDEELLPVEVKEEDTEEMVIDTELSKELSVLEDTDTEVPNFTQEDLSESKKIIDTYNALGQVPYDGVLLFGDETDILMLISYLKYYDSGSLEKPLKIMVGSSIDTNKIDPSLQGIYISKQDTFLSNRVGSFFGVDKTENNVSFYHLLECLNSLKGGELFCNVGGYSTIFSSHYNLEDLTTYRILNRRLSRIDSSEVSSRLKLSKKHIDYDLSYSELHLIDILHSTSLSNDWKTELEKLLSDIEEIDLGYVEIESEEIELEGGLLDIFQIEDVDSNIELERLDVVEIEEPLKKEE